MSANKFVLKNHHVEIDYVMSGTPGLPQLTYKEGSRVKTFKSTEITRLETALGLLVSVPLKAALQPGAGTETFGFFLPEFDVAMGKTVKFSTVGVHDIRPGPVHPPIVPKWTCVELHGTAQTVIVPMAELVPTS